MPVAIPHQSIREVADRSWTFRLLDAVRSPESTAEERMEALATIRWLEDPRALGPLTRILEDLTVDAVTRKAASDAVCSYGDGSDTSEDHRRWWASGDQVQMGHALALMRGEERTVVLATAADDGHPLQAEALHALAFGFSDLDAVPILLRALEHPEPTVRWSAVDALYWFDAAASEGPLIAALDDADQDVAVRAAEALEYLATRRVLRALAHVAASASGELLEAASYALDGLKSMVEEVERCAGSACAREQMVAWLRPVADLVAAPTPDEPSASRPASPPVPAPQPVPAHELCRLLADPDGPWAAKKMAVLHADWTKYPAEDHRMLAAVLVNHPDPAVRAGGTRAFAQWSDSDHLRALIDDPDRSVRKSAMYSLSLLERDESLAPLAWAAMLRETGTPSTEALDTYVVHAPREEAVERLEKLAREDLRVEIRMLSVEKLKTLRACAAIERLAAILNEPPHTHWSLHVVLLDAIRELDLSAPDLNHLQGVDDLHLHAAVVQLRCR